jgi:acetate kinase
MSVAGEPRVLVLNAGSSSLKFAFFVGVARRHHGQVEGIGARPRFVIDGEPARALAAEIRHAQALDCIVEALAALGVIVAELDACGHRIVHAASLHVGPTLLDADRLATINALRSLAPLHNGYGLDAIEALRRTAPRVPQIACFDTAFHASVPEVAARYALSKELDAEGFRRYGFHGLNFEHVTTTLAAEHGARALERLLIFHLGNGCSLCAVREGRSVATTMGYSTLDGLVMGTRCGSIDPGVLIALLRDRHMSVEALEALLYRRSGLLGLSGLSSDMRELERSDDAPARFAIEHFCYWAARHAGSLAVALGGVESIAFTGGIGCGSARVRSAIAAHLAWLGLELDPARNAAGAGTISSASSRCSAFLVPADEERAILRHVHQLLGAAA